MDKGFETIEVLERNRQPLFSPKVNPLSPKEVEYSFETDHDGPAGTIVYEIPKSKLTNYSDNNRLQFQQESIDALINFS